MNALNRLTIAALTLAFSIASANAADQARDDSRSNPVAQPGGKRGLLSLQLWHAAARDAIARDKPNQQAALRLIAYLSLAQQQAAQAWTAAEAGAEDGTWDVLFDEVSARTLTGLLPARRASFDALSAALAQVRAPVAVSAQLDDVRRVAATAAQETLARAGTDRFDAPWNGASKAVPHIWRSQLNPPRPPHLPMLGTMQPVHLASGAALRPPAPPAVGSVAFDHALAEVRQRAGSGDAQGRERARRWEMTTGALVAGYWDQVALELSAEHRLSGADASRVVGQALTAALDANIACHDAKYTYWTPRPSQVDPSIRPLIGLPNHPSYPSNHACDSGAAAYVLAALFPSRAAELLDQAREAGESRIDAGLHYRFDIEAGMQIARGAAAAALGRPLAQTEELRP